VIVKKLALCVADRPDMELDLSGDLTNLKKQVTILFYILKPICGLLKI
jgi:Rho GDP-dissociation inhibitor